MPASLVVLAATLAGCSTSAIYLGSTAQEFYFKLPRHWTVYRSSGLRKLGLPNTSQAAQMKAQGNSYPVYSSFASTTGNLGPKGLAGPHVWALGLVMALGGTDQTNVSLGTLQDEIFNVDGASSAGATVTRMSATKVVVRGALRGTLVTYKIQAGTSSLAFEQEALLDSPTNKVWLLAAGCSPTCFRAHRSEIDQIVGTFTVTTGRS